MKLLHLAYFEFTAADLADGFLFDLRQPDEAFLRMDDDGFGGERAVEKLIRTRRNNGLPEVQVLNTMLDQPARRFVPAYVREATVVKGTEGEAQQVVGEVIKWMQDNKARSRGYQCGVFRWGGHVLWLHFTEEAPVAAVVADQFKLKSHRSQPEKAGWRKQLTSAAFQ